MRISDWSSYVCSSDLTEIEVEIGREALPLDVIVAIVDLFGKDQAVVVAPSVRLDIIGLELALIIGDAARHAEAVRQEIGRASCRERVCQSVEILVVAGTLKKKKNKITTTYHK